MSIFRCEAFKLLYSAKADEKIVYLDVNSLYPSILRGTTDKPFPVGKPVIIRSNFGDLEQYFGIAHVKLLPPKNLLLPILPLLLDKKIYYTLCRTCASEKPTGDCDHTDEERSFVGVFTTPELQIATANDYRITRMFEVWHYPQSSTSLFTKFIDDFYAVKIKNSGWPKTVTSKTQKNEFLNTLKQRYGITLLPEDIVENPTQRLIAKIMLNSSWVSFQLRLFFRIISSFTVDFSLQGRFALRSRLPQTEWVETVNRLNELIHSTEYEVDAVDILDDGELLQVQYTSVDEFSTQDVRSNVILAGFVTSYARIVLYKAMQKVGAANILYTGILLFRETVDVLAFDTGLASQTPIPLLQSKDLGSNTSKPIYTSETSKVNSGPTNI